MLVDLTSVNIAFLFQLHVEKTTHFHLEIIRICEYLKGLPFVLIINIHD